MTFAEAGATDRARSLQSYGARRWLALIPLVAALAISGCDRRPDVGPVVVSVIGEAPQLRDPSRGIASEPDRALVDAVAEGLVRFDAAGQIEPGIAARWIVTDDGQRYIFRLRDIDWSHGRPLRASEVVTILRRQTGPGSRNPLMPFLSAIGSIEEMTPQVIQIELSRPRPDLLKLFAQPELAILRVRPPGGAGPFRIVERGRHSVRLAPVADLERAADERHEPTPEDQVRLIGERAAAAVARFVAKRSDLVSGGTVADWPLVAAAGVAPANIRLDPAAGLFGLVVVDRSGFLGPVENRAAVARAIDRASLTLAFAKEWAPADRILPDTLDSAAPPAPPVWGNVDPDERSDAALAAADVWRRGTGSAPVLRLALPAGAGGTLLWGRLAADLLAAGIRPERVALEAPADLRLIDAVAPYDSARWYLATACAPCGDEAAAEIEAARIAPTLAGRGVAIARADAALAADIAFIPLARPFRWSLVAERLRAWQPNARAWHPLNRLRRDTN